MPTAALQRRGPDSGEEHTKAARLDDVPRAFTEQRCRCWRHPRSNPEEQPALHRGGPEPKALALKTSAALLGKNCCAGGSCFHPQPGCSHEVHTGFRHRLYVTPAVFTPSCITSPIRGSRNAGSPKGLQCLHAHGHS